MDTNTSSSSSSPKTALYGFLIFLVGLIIGAALALLLTPEIQHTTDTTAVTDTDTTDDVNPDDLPEPEEIGVPEHATAPCDGKAEGDSCDFAGDPNGPESVCATVMEELACVPEGAEPLPVEEVPEADLFDGADFETFDDVTVSATGT